ncbi:MAG: hypothetical protein K2X37_06180 [Chitinophagaceae bacterium]|nr:hypothetical protein [Chitinophagaceae bacterium]
MEAYNNFYAANQLHGSKNAPIGIILCNRSYANETPFMIMNLPNRVLIVHPQKTDNEKEVVTIDPNAKVY